MQVCVQSLLVAIIIFLSFCHATPSFTWWIDQASCGNYQNLPSAVYEAISIANGASDSLGLDVLFQDPVLESYFQRIFMAPRSDVQSFQSVLSVLLGISNLTRTFSREESNIRIYCDNDRRVDPNDPTTSGNRWSLVPDNQLQNPGPMLNSQRMNGINQEWQDTTNGVRMDLASTGCLTPNVAAETQFQQPAGRPLTIATVTICDSTLITPPSNPEEPDPEPPMFTYVQDLTAQTDLTGQSLDAIATVITFTILHEFAHFPGFRPQASEHVSDFRYDWGPIQELPNNEAIYNAESYAFFGLLLFLRQRHFQLSGNQNQATLGILEFVP